LDNISLKPSAALAGLGLIIGLVACDAFLMVHSFHQSAVINGFADKQAAMLPPQGASLPTINGVGLSGKEFGVLPAQTPRFALLVFRQTCGYCEINWKNWDSLFAQSNLDMPVVIVTADKTISQTYITKHPLVRSRFLIAGIDASTLESLKLDVTPQTIYVVDGKISHDWAGVLTADDMSEIKKTMHSD
jgi:hypothetical protein